MLLSSKFQLFLCCFLLFLWLIYNIYPKYWDRQAGITCVDPDKIVESGQDLHCLPLIQQFLDISAGSNINLYKF